VPRQEAERDTDGSRATKKLPTTRQTEHIRTSQNKAAQCKPVQSKTAQSKPAQQIILEHPPRKRTHINTRSTSPTASKITPTIARENSEDSENREEEKDTQMTEQELSNSSTPQVAETELTDTEHTSPSQSQKRDRLLSEAETARTQGSDTEAEEEAPSDLPMPSREKSPRVHN
jgi:hypothetical protein